MAEEFTEQELTKAAQRLGYSSAMKQVLDHALESRKAAPPPIASDDDTVTIGELRAWIDRKLTGEGKPASNLLSITRGTVDYMAADIHAHREPEYPAGTVVEDANGTRWKRSKYGWMQGAYIWGPAVRDDSVPVRPLKVIP